MTNIRQHLPAILTTVRQHMNNGETSASLCSRLRALLPASYGVASGQLMNVQGQQSSPLDVIIYDTTLSFPQQPTALAGYDVRQALAVIMLAQDTEPFSSVEPLNTIASVKRLRVDVYPSQSLKSSTRNRTDTSSRPAERKPALKKLLPLAIVAYQDPTDQQSEQLASLALRMDAALKMLPEQVRPDYVLTQKLVYTNPLLDGGVFVASTVNIAREPRLAKPHPCYVCKQPYSSAHFFYRSLCLPCGDVNYQRRHVLADCSERVALVTGARVKIGYATALRLLRAGAQVIATTRFPHDAVLRYSSEPDFADWQDRLHIYGLDFRYLPVLERFVEHLYATYPALDILINSAAQTVRRPVAYYAHLLAGEQAPLATLTPAQQALVERSHAFLPPTFFAPADNDQPPLLTASALEEVPSATLLREYGAAAVSPYGSESAATFPVGRYDEHQQQLDLRARNSWTLPFNEIDLTEFLEVQVINVTAPFLLVSRLHALMKRSPCAQRFIINVSAVEGQFANTKFGSHVHTNMAKASLNMLTHTAATQLARDQIFMNSVDPGWISQQAPLTDTQNWQRIQSLLPLDLSDAAARVCDPIFQGLITGEAASGVFYKDYQPTSW